MDELVDLLSREQGTPARRERGDGVETLQWLAERGPRTPGGERILGFAPTHTRSSAGSLDLRAAPA